MIETYPTKDYNLALKTIAELTGLMVDDILRYLIYNLISILIMVYQNVKTFYHSELEGNLHHASQEITHNRFKNGTLCL